MMTGVHQHFRAWTRASRQMEGHSPIGDIGVINRWLKGLVFHEQPLLGRETLVHLFQRIFEPRLALPDISCARIARAVCEPQGYVAAVQTPCNLNAVLRVLKRACSYVRIWITKGAVFIFLILEQIWINRSGLHAKSFRKVLDVNDTFDSVRQIP